MAHSVFSSPISFLYKASRGRNKEDNNEDNSTVNKTKPCPIGPYINRVSDPIQFHSGKIVCQQFYFVWEVHYLSI